jgi:hypothetical protein
MLTSIKKTLAEARKAVVADIKDAVRIYFLPLTAAFKAMRDEFKRG